MSFEIGTRVTYKDRVGTVEGSYLDYYGDLYLKVRWDGAKRRSNVAAKNAGMAA